MSILSRSRRRETPAARRPGVQGKARTTLTAAVGAAKATAIDSVKQGITTVSTKIGNVAGAGLGVLASGALDTVGVHASPVVAGGAALVGAGIGGLAGKVMTAGLNRVTTGGGGAIATHMAELSQVLQLINEAQKTIAAAVEAATNAQGFYLRASEGSENMRLQSAKQHSTTAPTKLTEGLQALAKSQEQIVQRLGVIAGGGG